MLSLTLTLTLIAMFTLPQPVSRATSVLLIPTAAKDDKSTHDFKTALPLTTREDGVLFDLNGDGKLEQVAWTKPDTATAFLAIDRNGNGVIDSGRELVAYPSAQPGLSAIDTLTNMPQSQDDTDEGGPAWINHRDEVYEQLLLWTDSNHNGVSEPNELRKVSDVLTRIGLGCVRFNRPDDYGNVFVFQCWVSMRTAPGPNMPSGRDEERNRARRMYEVVLKSR
jgi:hypothetical protein